MYSNPIVYFAISLILSAIFQFMFIRLSHSKGIFIDDHESDLPQKFHQNPTPRVGGLGLFASCLLFAAFSKTGLLLLGCSLPAFMAGLMEDLYLNLSPNKRLIIMLASGILPALLLNVVIIDFGLFTVPYFCGVMISFVAVLGIINGTNMIDGFNGLLGGVSLIIFGSFSYMAFYFHDQELLIINVVIVAGILGFILFNYPGGSIFMGDGGAYLIGFLMAVISMLLVKRHPEINPFFVLACISYPVMEVIFSFTRKGLIHHASPFLPDRNHLHMLVNRHIVKGNNSKTILVFAPAILIFNLVAIYYYQKQEALMLLTATFIFLYLLSYYLLLKYQQKVEKRKGRFLNTILQKIKKNRHA